MRCAGRGRRARPRLPRRRPLTVWRPPPPPLPLSLRAANLKIWKKDYDRVVALAKGAHRAAVTAPEVQAEALYLLARVHHAKGKMEHAHQFYEKACLRDPGLSPARFGLAQTLIWDESYDEAAAHLRLLLGTCARATDALAALGLLEAKAGRDRREAFGYLRKAIDLDPFNADLVRIEALALQQHEGDYPAALARYRRTVRLLEAQGRTVPANVLTNMGVLCHETRAHGEALEMYGRALAAVEAEAEAWRGGEAALGGELGGRRGGRWTAGGRRHVVREGDRGDGDGGGGGGRRRDPPRPEGRRRPAGARVLAGREAQQREAPAPAGRQHRLQPRPPPRGGGPHHPRHRAPQGHPQAAPGVRQ